MNRHSPASCVLGAVLAAPLLLGPSCATTTTLPQDRGRPERTQGSVGTPKESPPAQNVHPAGSPAEEAEAEFWPHLVGIVLLAPVWVPVVALGDFYERSAFFPAYPYEASDGYLGLERREWRAWSLRTAVEGGYDFAHEVGRSRLSVLCETTSRFGIQGSLDRFDNDLDLEVADDLALWDVNAVFRFAQSEQAQFRAGVGLRFETYRQHTEGGFNFTYGAEFFPARPLVLSVQADYGNLGSTGVAHHRATLGFLLKRFEFFAGFDHMSLDGSDSYGPLAGLRLWF